MTQTMQIPGRNTALRRAFWTVAALFGVAIASSAQAGPFKQNMQRFNETTKAAKAEIGAFDPGRAAGLLQQYTQEAQEGATLTAKSKDLHARFVRLASTAESGAAAASDRTRFRKIFVDIATQCRSCHSVYK